MRFKHALGSNSYNLARDAAVKTLSDRPIFSKLCENGAKLNMTKLDVLKEHRSGFLGFINSVFVGIEKQIDAIVKSVKEVWGVLVPAFASSENIIETKPEKLLIEVDVVIPPLLE